MYRMVVKATLVAKKLVAEIVKPGDTVVDATLGNGNDTLFLSRIIQNGRVYSFDIQKTAVEKFKEIIEQEFINNVILINDGHQNMEKYINQAPSAIMFNLGYLPGGDKNILTRGNTTADAVTSGLRLLKPGGIMTIICYIGHDGGGEEQIAVEDIASQLSPINFSVFKLEYFSKNNNAPILYAIEKSYR